MTSDVVNAIGKLSELFEIGLDLLDFDGGVGLDGGNRDGRVIQDVLGSSFCP